MPKSIQVSDDGVSWVELKSLADPNNLTTNYIKVIDEFDPSWDNGRVRSEVDKVHSESGSCIEYSNDGGYSWVPLRLRYPDEDTARIMTLLKSKYAARTVKVTSTSKPSVVNDQHFFRKLNKSDQVRQANSTAYIFRDKATGQYDFGLHKPDALKFDLMSRVDRTIFYDMQTPNENSVQLLNGSLDSPLDLGFLFKLVPAKASVPLWANHINGINIDEWWHFTTPRVFDDALAPIFHGCKVYAVLGMKYVTTNISHPHKLGDSFIVHQSDLISIKRRIKENNGLIVNEQSDNPIFTPSTRKQFSVEEIMTMRKDLERLIKNGSAEELTDMAFKATEYRDQAVDELKLLNVAIKDAKTRAMELLKAG